MKVIDRTKAVTQHFLENSFKKLSIKRKWKRKFCHGALKHDISTLFTTFFVWTSIQFIFYISIHILVSSGKTDTLFQTLWVCFCLQYCLHFLDRYVNVKDCLYLRHVGHCSSNVNNFKTTLYRNPLHGSLRISL